MENDKNIYDMLNDIEIDLDEYEKEDFTDIEKMKYKKAFRESTKANRKYNNKNYKKYISAASIAVVALGIFSQGRLGVYAYSAVVDVVERIQLALGLDESLEEYAKNINQSVTKKGLTVKINEILLDGSELIVSMRYDYDKELKEDEVLDLMRERLYINGKEINYSSNIGYYTKLDRDSKEFIIGYDLGKVDYDGDINVKIKIVEARIWENEESEKSKRILGPWTFKFTVNGEKLREDTKYLTINKDLKLDTNEYVEVVEYEYNSLYKKIIVKTNDNSVDIYSGNTFTFKGRDDKGNRVDFIRKYNNHDIEQETSKYEFIFDNANYEFDETATKLYLTPYTIVFKDGNGEEISDFENVEGEVTSEYKKIGEEFIINLDK